MNRNLNQVQRCSCCKGSGLPGACKDVGSGIRGGGKHYTKFLKDRADEDLSFRDRMASAERALREIEGEVDKRHLLLARNDTPESRKVLAALQRKISALQKYHSELREAERNADIQKLISDKQVEKKEEKTAVHELVNNRNLSAKKRREYEQEVAGKTFYDNDGNPLMYDEASGNLIKPRTTTPGEYRGVEGIKKRIPKRKY